MKKFTIVCALVFGVMTFAQAQDGRRNMPSPEERATRMTATLTNKLTLSADQQTKIKAIFMEQQAERTKERADASVDRKAAREKMMESAKANDAKINAVLNDDQKKAYQTYQEERKSSMADRGRGNRNK